jgi:hypothetical protein
MPNEDHPANLRPVKSPIIRPSVWLVVVMLAVGGLFTVFALHDDDDATATSSSGVVGESPSSPTMTSIDSKSELVARLKEILAIRERAYQNRDPEVLKRIYTVDCPCLESDSNAIRELIREHYVWVGGKTSLRIRTTERVTARMWIIIADFGSAPLRIETESGRLVREEPQGKDVFQFVLAKPTESTQWFLGRASSYEDG